MSQILVIEDDRDIRDLLRDVLTDEGYELLFVEHPDRAPADAAPDLVVTDLLGLQHYDSGAARASIRRLQERYAAAPVFVCTAQEEAIDEPDRLAALMGKPFTIELLLETLARLAAP